MSPAIEIAGLSKLYRIGANRPGQYRTLRESLAGVATATLRRLRGRSRDGARAAPGTFWALRDVTFEVEAGEVVGIIGRNGAGKSTLLKLLCRITEPTEGRAVLSGRIGSLLEVGTGFHPELTGRENIYLNGSILGMTRREIERRFDEIVAFAEVERFLDTPVKRYSSGMYMRLAFAVAAHLETEILIVDEVLAVGDIAFQKKCLSKMGQVARGGRTVLFVSHNMATVQNLCSKAVLLASGRVQAIGPVADVLSAYLLPHSASDDQVPLSSFRPAGLTPIIQEVRVYNHEGVPTSHVYAGASVTFEMVYDSPIPLKRPVFCVYIQGMNGEPLVHLHTRSQHPEVPSVPDRGVVRCHVPSLPLFPGSYSLGFSCAMVHTDGVLDFLDRAVSLEVEPADYFGTGRLPMRKYGVFLVRADWTLPGGAAGDSVRGRPAECRGGVAEAGVA